MTLNFSKLSVLFNSFVVYNSILSTYQSSCNNGVSEFPGMNNVKCHQKFKRCIKKVQKSGKPGFSTVCPVDVAVPTMDQGMDMAIMFSQFGNSKLEL